MKNITGMLSALILAILLCSGCTNNAQVKPEPNEALSVTTTSRGITTTSLMVTTTSTLPAETATTIPRITPEEIGAPTIKVFDDGFTSSYKSYRFRLDRIIHNPDNEIAGAVIDVQRPDGTLKIVELGSAPGDSGKVDNLRITFDSKASRDSEEERWAAIRVEED